MIPNADQLRTIARLQHGDLAEIPFAVLLYALAVHQRSGVLEIERKPLRKEIILEDGVPVDCRSNLLHETLGRFMVTQEVLTEEQAQICLAKSATRGLPLGEVMILEGLISASDLYKVLQQNLAKKLLDGFTWRSGSFRLLPELPEVDSPLKVNAPQLVLTGISKFALDQEVNEAVGPLVGKTLYVHPSPPYPLDELHLTNEQKQLTTLVEGGKRVDELAATTTIPFDKIMRLLYSLAIIGIVVPEEQMPATPAAAPTPTPEPAPVPEAPAAAVAEAVDPTEVRNAVMEAYLKYRKQDAFDLLGVPETASLVDIQQHYLDFSRRFAPWSFTTPPLESLAEKAEDLFLAGGMAMGELCDVERRNALIARRRTLREEQEKGPDPERFAIKSELLDSEVQFKKGKALMEVEKFHEARQQLQFAYDCDPQNSIYRAELAYCRYMDVPSVETEKSLNSLRETIRIDPQCGLAFLYAGEIHRELGNVERAEYYLQKAIKMMMPDRRPIEALKALQSKSKKKRRR